MAHADRPWHERLRSPWPWHRWLGLASALILLWVALTGILLVHADDLGFSQRPVRTVWVLDLFGVPEPEVEIGYRTPLGWVAQAGDRVQLDAVALPAQLGALNGVATFEMVGAPRAVGATGARGATGVLVAGSEALLLLDAQGALLEVLPPGADPGVGVLNPALPEALPDDARRVIATAARGALLGQEQVLRVLHGSHGTGWLGVLIADLTALALIVLTLTGFVMHRQKSTRERAQAEAHREKGKGRAR